MRSPFPRALAVLALGTLAAGARVAAGQQATSTTTTTTTTTVTTTRPAPNVGDVAPSFSMPWADASGARATPVSLADLKGKVVVLAFYPKDRTSGCTAEMTKFRDEYASLFGDGVVVVPVSADSIPSHVSWATDMKFPFALASDVDLATADVYGSHVAGRPMANRTVFVIGKDGRITWRELRFNALSEDAYKSLADAVKAAK
jgi:thioredoxin-dependent peroxiredoxin